MMNLSKSIDFLLENACVSIRYLVYRDILGTQINDPMMKDMREVVLQQKTVQKHLAAQHPDGWLGHELHGGDGMDCHIGSLLGLGVEVDDPHIQKALNALRTPEIAEQHKNYFAGGAALDADGRGGNKAIIAGILASLREDENNPLIADEINLALKHFKGALNHNCIDDFTIVANDKSKTRYYKPNALFPGANHIGLLANTRSWQTDENLQTAKAAMAHCYSLMKNVEGGITFRKPKEYGGGFVGPFNFNWQALNPIEMSDLNRIIDNSYRFSFGFWLRSITGFPQWGLQTTQPYLLLADLLETDTLMNIFTDDALAGFRYISGIEPNWRNNTAVKCDLTFAVLRACWPML